MSRVEIFDPAMCCSTGVCGPSVDPALVQFAADVEWLKRRGVDVARYNLSQQPQAFVTNTVVREAMHQGGVGALPLVLVGGQVAFRGAYPSRTDLCARLGLPDVDEPGSDDQLRIIQPNRCC